MKKLSIAVIVALLLAALAGKYYSDKRQNRLRLEVLSEVESAVRTGQVSAATSSGPSRGGAAVPFPAYSADPNAGAGITPGSSVKDMLAEYGKLWGGHVKNDIITEADAEGLMSMLREYFSCRAIVMDDTGECSPLPDNGTEPQKRTRKQCAYMADTAMIGAYMAGRNKSFKSCARFCQWVDADDIREHPQKYCSHFSLGLEHFCDDAPPERMKECHGAFPTKRSDCDIARLPNQKNPDTCPDRLDLYTAMKAGDPELCPSKYKSSCRAFLSGDMAVCSKIAIEASIMYGTMKERMTVEKSRPKVMPGVVRSSAPAVLEIRKNK